MSSQYNGATLLLWFMKTADGDEQANVGCLKSVGFWPGSCAMLQNAHRKQLIRLRNVVQVSGAYSVNRR